MLLLLIDDRPWVASTWYSLVTTSTGRPTDHSHALSFTLFLHHLIRRYEICAIAHNQKREMHVPWLYDFPTTQHDNVPPLIRFSFFFVFLRLSSAFVALFVASFFRWPFTCVECQSLCVWTMIIIIISILLLCFWLVLSVQLFCCSSSSRNGYTTQQQLPRL